MAFPLFPFFLPGLPFFILFLLFSYSNFPPFISLISENNSSIVQSLPFVPFCTSFHFKKAPASHPFFKNLQFPFDSSAFQLCWLFCWPPALAPNNSSINPRSSCIALSEIPAFWKIHNLFSAFSIPRLFFSLLPLISPHFPHCQPFCWQFPLPKTPLPLFFDASCPSFLFRVE